MNPPAASRCQSSFVVEPLDAGVVSDPLAYPTRSRSATSFRDLPAQEPNVFFRAMVYATGKSGHIVEALCFKVRRGEASQNFNSRIYGEPGTSRSAAASAQGRTVFRLAIISAAERFMPEGPLTRGIPTPRPQRACGSRKPRRETQRHTRGSLCFA